jgi:hypothetical protein
MEPLTEHVRELLQQDIEAICSFDPRAYPIQIDISEYEQGYLVEITLAMRNTDESTTMKLVFDQKLGLTAQ